jgi:AcrR family transcriptional regulator
MNDARSRVLKAAIACFGAKGYAATKIADIEHAAGLTPGAGGTYRHFPSKRAILEAVIDSTVGASDDELAPPQTDLEQTAHDSLRYMSRDMMRIFFRDLEQFPEQRDRIVDRMVTGPYRIVASRIAKQNPNIDAEATAAVLLGSLINFRVIEVLIGKGRNGVSQERFVNAWAELYRLRLEPSQTNPPKTKSNKPRKSPAPSKRPQTR